MQRELLDHRFVLWLVIVVLTLCGACSDDINVCNEPLSPRHQESFPPSMALEWSFTDNWMLFSSPRAGDLTGNCVQDIVMGYSWIEGQIPSFESSEEEFLRGGVVALDGYTGEELWRVDTHQAMVGSALLLKLDEDDVDDVVMGGRTIRVGWCKPPPLKPPGWGYITPIRMRDAAKG